MFKYIFTNKYWSGILLLTQVIIARKNSNTFLGSLWGLIQPFLHITVISFFMSFLLRFEPKIIISNLVGALPFWTFIMTSLADSSMALTINSQVLKRALLPKTYFPISNVLGNSYTLLYSFAAMYFSFLLFFPEAFTWKIIFVPLLSLPLIISVMTSSIVTAYLTPYIQDTPQFIHVLLGILYWTVPIIYPYSLIPESKLILFELNPIYIVIKPMQDLVITGELPSIILIIKSWVVCTLVSIISYFIYKKLAKNVIYYL